MPVEPKPGTHNRLLLDALRSGPKSATELYALNIMTHSRSSDLRRLGYEVKVTKVPGRGTKGYVYSLGMLDAGREAHGTGSKTKTARGRNAPRGGTVTDTAALPASSIPNGAYSRD